MWRLKGKDQKECELIEPYDEEKEVIEYSYKCVYEGEKCIKKEKTSCLDYKSGRDELHCNLIKLTDEKKACVLWNNDCKETYKSCEDYDGENQNICESILPTYEKDDIIFIEYDVKCILKDNQCVATDRYCSDFIFPGESCLELKAKDENKICNFYGRKCFESYEKCEDYNQNVDKETCEKIIPGNYYTRCVYDNENRECISKALSCSSFQIDLLKDECETMELENNMKCFYNNGKCSSSLKSSENVENKGKNYFYNLFLKLLNVLIL